MTKSDIICVLIVWCSGLRFCEGIYGGRLAKGSEVPWTILITSSALSDQPEATMCSGSLITFQLVLTAAHCVQMTKREGSYSFAGMTLHAGYTLGSDKQIRKSQFCVSRKIVLPFYAGSHDIAVIKADTPFQPAYGVQPIPIAFKNYEPGIKCIMAGHGKRPNKETGLNCMIISMVQKGCTQEVTGCDTSDIIGPEPMTVCPNTDEGNGGLCKGDSGSGLVCNGSIYGVAHIIGRSESSILPLQDDCGMTSVLSVYVNIYPHRDWVHKAIAKLEASRATSFLVPMRFSSWNDPAVTHGFLVLMSVLTSISLSSILKT